MVLKRKIRERNFTRFSNLHFESISKNLPHNSLSLSLSLFLSLSLYLSLTIHTHTNFHFRTRKLVNYVLKIKQDDAGMWLWLLQVAKCLHKINKRENDSIKKSQDRSLRKIHIKISVHPKIYKLEIDIFYQSKSKNYNSCNIH